MISSGGPPVLVSDNDLIILSGGPPVLVSDNDLIILSGGPPVLVPDNDLMISSGGPPVLVPDPVCQVPEGGQGQAAEDGPDELDLCQRFTLHDALPTGVCSGTKSTQIL
jgi:hypothetical protein